MNYLRYVVKSRIQQMKVQTIDLTIVTPSILSLVYCDMSTWSVTRQRLSEHVSSATDTLAIVEELLGAVFSVLSVPRLYKEGARVA
jgi:hypothetical protein